MIESSGQRILALVLLVSLVALPLMSFSSHSPETNGWSDVPTSLRSAAVLMTEPAGCDMERCMVDCPSGFTSGTCGLCMLCQGGLARLPASASVILQDLPHLPYMLITDAVPHRIFRPPIEYS